MTLLRYFIFFFFNDTATTEIYTLSLHDALPILELTHIEDDVFLGPHVVFTDDPHPQCPAYLDCVKGGVVRRRARIGANSTIDRKSTRLNSSHLVISYAVFCLQKKKTRHTHI